MATQKALFSLDGKAFASSFENLESAARYYNGAYNSFAYFTTGTGGGRFTNLASAAFIQKIKGYIDSPNTNPPGVNYSSLDIQYERWKNKRSSGGFGKLYGHLRDTIKIIGIGKHGQTVGIDRKTTRRRIGLDGKTYGKIRVAEYASWLEWGNTQQDARPLFSPVLKEFIAKEFPEMLTAFRVAFIKANKKYLSENLSQKTSFSGSGASSGDILGAASTQGGSDLVTGAYVQEAVSIGNADTIMKTTASLSSKSSKYIIKSVKDANEIRAWMAKNKLSKKDFERIGL